MEDYLIKPDLQDYIMTPGVLEEEHLEHHGVKGMRWGVRKDRQKGVTSKRGKRISKSVAKKAKKKSSSDSENDSAVKKKKISDMTDSELDSAIKRLELEKKYKDLSTTPGQKRIQSGREYAYDILRTIGKNTLVNVGSQVTTHMLGTAINKAAGVNITDKDYEKKRLVNPQKGQADKK